MFKYLFKKKFDIIGLSETNLHWPSLSPLDNWDERVQGKWESLHTSMCYNTQEPVNTAWQPGGCLQMSANRMTHLIISSGKDETGSDNGVGPAIGAAMMLL